MKAIINVNGENNVNLIFSAMTLGLLELIEKGVITHGDASMMLFISMSMNEKITDRNIKKIMGLSSELDGVLRFIPDKYQKSINQIKELCLKAVENFKRDDGIKINIVNDDNI